LVPNISLQGEPFGAYVDNLILSYYPSSDWLVPGGQRHGNAAVPP
jgi:hypothetical protein